MIIDCIADLHGYLPPLEGGDLLIVAGDLTSSDKPREIKAFDAWLRSQDYKRIVVIAGNHDNTFQNKHVDWGIDDPKISYLCDTGIEFEGLNIWGSPWTLFFHGVNPECAAFMWSEEELEKKWALIPESTDILVTHGPPFGILDTNWYDFQCGSISLRKRIDEIKPKLHVFGHIHENGGKKVLYKHLGPNTIMVNASYVDERYRPIEMVVRVEL